MFIGLVTLPRVGPAAVEATHGVGIRTGNQQLLAFCQRQYTVCILQKYQRFFGSLEGGSGMFRTTEQGEVFQVIIGLFKQIETVLQAQYTANSIVNAAHGDFSFFHQLLQECTELPVVRVHRHVDTGIDGELDGFLLVLGNVVAAIKVVDVRPVSHNHTVPVEVFFQPLGQQLIVGMERQTVVHGGVHHHGEGTCLHHFQIRSEMLLTHILLGDGRRRTVLTGNGNTITHIVLHTSGNVVLANQVGVLALETDNCFTSHFGIDVGVFTIVFPHTRPARVTSEVGHRGIRPGNASRLCFISGDACTFTCQFTVEGSSHIDALREESTTQRIGSSVYLVYTVHTRNTHHLHGFLLNAFDDFLPLLHALCHTVGHVQDGAYFVFSDDRVEHRLVQLEALGILNALDTHIELHHHILRRHLLAQLEFLFKLVSLDDFLQVLHRDVLRVEAGKGIGAFLQEVDSEFAHLTDFLVKRHLLQQSLNLLFYFLVSWNGRRNSGLRRSSKY